MKNPLIERDEQKDEQLIVRAVDLLRSDFERQSKYLSLDDFNRIASKLNLGPITRKSAVRQLKAIGIRLTDESELKSKTTAESELGDIHSRDSTTYRFHSLLSHEEEITLARRYQTSLILKEDSPSKELRENDQLISAGMEARGRLILSNIRLVHDRVDRFESITSLAREDLVQEGILGLFRAVEKFEPERGFRFGTYATWWIDQKIARLIADKGQLIRIPVHIQRKLAELKRRQRELEVRFGRIPTTTELARELGDTVPEVEFLRAVRSDIMSAHDEAAIDNLSQRSSNGRSHRFDKPDEHLELQELKELVGATIGSLDNRRQKILKWRFGLDGKAPRTLEQIGERLGVTRERIRQLEKSALKKLALTQAGLSLRVYLPEQSEDSTSVEIPPGKRKRRKSQDVEQQSIEEEK
ncbi:MAG: sigma-70 family RNA polymerase sigma factor [Planctomycetota bacterium]